MLKVKNLLIAASVLVLLAGALTLFPPSPGHTQTAELDGFPVKVVNGTTAPVPTSVLGTATVSGIVNLANGAKVGIDPANSSVNIANTPTVNIAAGSKLTLDPTNSSVSIANTPTVALSATANSVRVSNTATTPAFVRNADDARQAFQADATVSVLNGATAASARLTTVPAGKRLIIEQISAIGAVSLVSAGGIASVQTSVDNKQVRHFINLNLQAFSAFSSFSARPTADQLTRIYADPGTDVDAVVNLDNSVGTSDVLQVSISGYLVDFP
jgi:hypothetical protein